MAALHPEAAPSSSSDELVVSKSVTSLKRKRDETNLVLCFARNDDTGANPILYTFRSHPIERFITKSDTPLKLEPVSQFVWKEVLDDEYKKLLYSPHYPHWLRVQKVLKQHLIRTLSPPYPDMRFLNAGNFIYAVGGQRHSEDLFLPMEELLPTDFIRIHLSPSLQNSRVELETLTQMPTRKLVGGIAEIRGRIYVISSPYNHQMQQQQHLFEVYDPSNNGWTSLPEPPYPPSTCSKLVCFAMNAKLYVSTYHYSSIYDPDLNAWEACTIFSDDATRRFFDPIPYCGPSFHFSVEPVVFKERFWVVPAFSGVPRILAYHISTDEKKRAKQIKFECDGLPVGHVENPLVDLGDDCFLAMFHEYPPLLDDAKFETVDDHYYLTAVTFKLIEKETQGDDSAPILKATIMSVHKIDSTFDLEKEGGEGAVWPKHVHLSLVSAFLQHSQQSM